MMKRTEITVFSNEWFEYHQSKLLWFANTLFGRYVLRIYGKRSDVRKNKITKITPNSISWRHGNKIKTEFRTHAKYSKRLYYAFKPFWHVLHAWDMLIANKLNYALNVGFDTLTTYPDAGAGSETVDGTVMYDTASALTWASIHDATVGTEATTTPTVTTLGITSHISTPDRYTQLRRSIALFNTSSLGNVLSIDDATLSYYGYVLVDTYSALTFAANVYSSNPASNSNLVVEDYNKDVFGTTPFSDEIEMSSFNFDGYNDYVLNSSGLSNINANGISKFSFRESNYDFADVAPTWGAGAVFFLAVMSSDRTGTAFDPKLVVTYQLAITTAVSSGNPYTDGKCMVNTGSSWSELTDTDMYFATYTSDNATTIVYNSTDPSSILTSVIDNYNTLGGPVTYSGTIDTTSTSVSYTFNTQTILQCINKIIELSPSGWYWYVDNATNMVHLHEKSATADHTLTLSKDIKLLDVQKSTENIINTVYFIGGDTGSGDNLFLKFLNSDSIAKYGVRSTVYSDKRVTLSATATTIATSILESKSTPEIRLVVEIADSNISTGGYNIESVKVGDVVNIRNVKGSTGSSLWDVAQWDIDYWDYNLTQISTMYLQIVRTEYKVDSLVAYCSTTPPDISKRIEDINRNLETLQTLDNPTAPTIN